MNLFLAGSIAGKTKEREYLLRKNHRLLSFFEINGKVFNAPLSFKIIKRRKTHKNLSRNLAP